MVATRQATTRCVVVLDGVHAQPIRMERTSLPLAVGTRWSGNLRAMTGGVQRRYRAVSVVVRVTSGSVEVLIVGRTVRLEVQRRFIEVHDEALTAGGNSRGSGSAGARR